MTPKFSLAGTAVMLMLFTALAVCHSNVKASHDAAVKPADDDVAAPQIAGPAPSTITTASYVALGTEVYNALQSVNSFSGTPVPGLEEADDDVPAPNPARQAIDLLMFAISGETPSGDARQSTCSLGGTADRVASRQQAARFSPGDRISLVLSDCQLNAGTRPLSGKAVFTFRQIDGVVSVGQPWHAAVDVQFHELAAAYSGHAIVGNGDLSVDIRQAGQGERIVRVHSARLSEETRSGLAVGIQLAPAAHTYSNYQAVETQEGSRSAWDVSFGLTSRNGYFYTSEYAVNTMQPMVFDGGKAPVSGKVKVTGKDSSVTLTMLEGEMVRLDLSENDDGIVSQSTFLPSSRLLAE